MHAFYNNSPKRFLAYKFLYRERERDNWTMGKRKSTFS